MRFIICLLVFGCACAWSKPLDLPELIEAIKSDEYKQMTSVLVQHQGQLVFEQYFNDGGVTEANDMRSASKSITSLAVGLAIQDGLLSDVNQPVMPFFKDKSPVKNPDPRKRQIKVEDLLTMSSVLECNDWNQASRGNEERMYLIEDWSRFILDLPVRGIPPWEQPLAERQYGRAFSYCTGGVQVLADLVERVSKQSMAAYLQQKLFGPLKINQPVFSKTPLGVTNGGGGMRMTSRDWIKLGQMMMDQGRYQGQQIINAKWVEASWQRRAVIDVGRGREYGYLWWVMTFDVDGQTHTAYAATGNGGNYLLVFPELSVVAVITSQAYNTPYMHQQSQEILTRHLLPAVLKTQ